MRYPGLEERRAASRCVLESFELHEGHHSSAKRALKRLNLEKYSYVAAHVRRGDFAEFRPNGQKSGWEIAESLNKHCLGKPLLVASDATPSDNVLQDIQKHSLASILLQTSEGLDEFHGDLSRAAADMLLCRWAHTFVGTQDSTFSNGIFAMRKKDSLLSDFPGKSEPLFLFGEIPREPKGGVCWERVTQFSHVMA
jgi:hypothetical protein